MSDTNNIHLSVKFIECPVCFKIFTNPFIVNCSSKCIVCERCLIIMFQTTNLQSDTTDGDVQELEKCICNTYANKRQCVPAIGIDRIIKNAK